LISAGAAPQTLLRELRVLPQTLAGFKRPTSNGTERRGSERREKEREGREGEYRKGVRLPIPNSWIRQ